MNTGIPKRDSGQRRSEHHLVAGFTILSITNGT
jgi:hypothetical protein